MGLNKHIDQIINGFASLEDVQVIMIGGSFASGMSDELSDYDLYIYSDIPITLDRRKSILDSHFEYIEYANTFWEEEDDGILLSGIECELIYRRTAMLQEELSSGFDRLESGFGYSTCFIDNILNSTVVFDRNAVMQTLKIKHSTYPEALARKIALNNMQLLYDRMPSLGFQIEKALKRRDLVSINHRLSEYLAIYFDILFALNKTFHKGEKRLLDYLDRFEMKPSDAKKDIQDLLLCCMTDDDRASSLVVKISFDMKALVESIYPEYKSSAYGELKI